MAECLVVQSLSPLSFLDFPVLKQLEAAIGEDPSVLSLILSFSSSRALHKSDQVKVTRTF